MCGLSSKRTGIRQCSSTTVTEKPTKRESSLVLVLTSRELDTLAGNIPIMSNEFYVMSLMALLNAVHTNGVAVRGVAGVTPGERHTGHELKRSGLGWGWGGHGGRAALKDAHSSRTAGNCTATGSSRLRSGKGALPCAALGLRFVATTRFPQRHGT